MFDSKQALKTNLDKLMSGHPNCNTQEEVAARSGLAQSTVGRAKRGDVETTLGTVDALAKVFGLTPSELIMDSLDLRSTELVARASAFDDGVLRIAQALAVLPPERRAALAVLCGVTFED